MYNNTHYISALKTWTLSFLMEVKMFKRMDTILKNLIPISIGEDIIPGNTFSIKIIEFFPNF